MNDEIKKLTRYEMTTEYNKYACEDVVRENASPDGEWVKYSDVLAIAERTSSAGFAVVMPDLKAWETIKEVQGTQTIDWKGTTAIVIESAAEAGDVARAILATAAPLYAAAQASAQADSLDAARYRWLRERMCFESSKGTEPEMSLARWIPAPLHDPHNDWMGERFDMSVDRTIDAAMSSTTGDAAIGEKGNG